MADPEITVPPLPLTGGCQCGAVRYAIAAAPKAFYFCHCTECQRQTSSAFGESLPVEPASLTVTGRMKTATRVADSGAVRLGDFCPECGVRLFHRSADDPDWVTVRAGTLDDTSWLRPAGHIWTASKQPFAVIAQGELSYPGEPDDGSKAIFARWKEMTGAGVQRAPGSHERCPSPGGAQGSPMPGEEQ